MALQQQPPQWGADEVTSFFDLLRGNAYATFVGMRPAITKLVAIDALYRRLQENLYNTKDWFSAFFLLRTHSNYLAAVRLAAAGQHPETFALLRSCLETALYGVYLARKPLSRELWLRRSDSDDTKRAVRNEFQWGKMLPELAALDRHEAEIAQALYERCIDFGAHPNEQALMQSLQINERAADVEFKVVYAGGEPGQFEHSLKSSAQVGVCAFSMFREIYRERCDLMGLTGQLRQAKVGL